jgi:outer membrane immunogenic protein
LEAIVKRFIVGVCVLVVLTTAASFGQSKVDDWKGFYAGANVGGAFGGSNVRTTTVLDPTAGYFVDTDIPQIAAAGKHDVGLDGFTGGVQLGYNATAGKTFLIGAEFDFGGMNLESTKTDGAVYICCPPASFSITQKVGASWLMTARPRIGITHGKALIYGTGGLAVTNIHDKVLFTDNDANALEGGGRNENKIGWTVGGGVEYQIKAHWSLKGEYLYVNFGRVSSTSTNLIATPGGVTPPTSFPTNVFTHSADLHANIIRAGLNYRF